MHNIQQLPADKEPSFTTTLYIKNGKIGLYNNKTLQILQMKHFEKRLQNNKQIYLRFRSK